MQKKIALTLYIWCALALLAFAQKQYTRIVSLGPSLTQSIYYLSAQDKLVGCTSYCEAAKNDRKTIVSSAVKMNMEKVLSLKPDLVLASGLTSPKDMETLQKFGIRVETFTSPTSFQEICEQFNRLGALIGKEQQAKRIVAESKQKVQQIAAKTHWKKTPKMFIQIGANPLFTVLSNTFMNDYILLMGAENIANGLTKGTIGREFVIAKNPDYILIVTMGIVGEEEKSIWEKYSTLTAAKKKRIYIINSDIACQPTPVTFAETMKTLDELINKEK